MVIFYSYVNVYQRVYIHHILGMFHMNGEDQGFNQGEKSRSIEVFTGWWLTYPSEKYDFVTWDDDIPN
jgi:hypothetical protein